MKPKRIFYYDVLRSLAIIGILFCHVSAPFVLNVKLINTNSYYISSFFDCLRDISIPIFVMISGSLLLNKNYPIKTFFKKRFSRVLIPFLFWVSVYIIISTVFIYPNIDFTTVMNIFLGENGTGKIFWFIWMIMIVYILIFIINKTINIGKTKFDNFDSILINILIICSFAYVLLITFNLIPNFNKIIFYMSFIFYAIIGYYLSKTDFPNSKLNFLKINKKCILILNFIISIIGYIYYIIGIVVPTSIKINKFFYLGYFDFIPFIISISTFLFFRYLSEYNGKFTTKFYDNLKTGKIGKIINSLSISSFGIYLSHYIILELLKKYCLIPINYTFKNPFKWILFLVVILLLISWIITIILAKNKYLKLVSGKG